MLSDTTKKTLIAKAKLIFVGLPVGKNAPGDSPILGNKTLAQVVVNRCDSITKTADEFKYLCACVMQMLKETKGKEVEKIKIAPTKELYDTGVIDQNGFMIKKNKKI